MRKIDIHTHVSFHRSINNLLTGTNLCTPEEYISIFETLGIEKGVILPCVNVECSYENQTNMSTFEVVEKYPQHFTWFCNVDPRAGENSPDTDLSYFLEYYKRLGAKGVGEICANLYFDDPLVENLFQHCENTGMPVLFHIGPQIGKCYGLVDEVGLYRLEKELKRFPGLKFLGHSQPFWAEISSDTNEENRNGYPKGKVNPGRLVELMRKYTNLYGDLSAGSGYNAVSRDAEFGYAFLEEFQDRLFFGTDICSPKQTMLLSAWLDDAAGNGRISEEAYRKISCENAMKLLDI